MSIKFFKRLAAISCVAVLAGCGAGGGSGGSFAAVGSGGTGLVSGTVTGFGSVIIDGNRYPDTTASYDITGDSSATQAISRTQVGIGERAEVDTDASGNATAVHIIPEVIGVVSAISATTNSLTVAGTRVVVNASDPTLPITVYDGYANFSAILVNDRIEVHGLPQTDAAGPYVAATRIELKPGVCTSGCPVRVSGTVSNLSPGATSFSLGGLTVNVGAATVITPTGQSLTNGERVSAFSSAPLLSSGTSMNADAIAIRKLANSVSAVSTLRLSGEIGNFVSNASFSVNGVSINAAAATLSPTSLNLANEADVIVQGSFDPATNLLTATSVSQYNSDTIQAELHGTVSNFVSAANFQVRGVLVDASSATFSGGTSANLQNNAYVEIHGRVSNNVVLASTVTVQSVQSASDGSVGDLRGVVSNFNAPTNAFTLTLDNENSSQVQAVLAASPFFIGGTLASLQNGAYVSLNAALVGSQWQVNTVTFMLAPQPSGDGSNGQSNGREMEGTINNLSGNTFSLNGITVDFSAAAISGGQPANGLQAQVYGTMSGSGSAMTLTASKMEIDN